MRTGSSIRRVDKAFETYMKNCCVALLSARKNLENDTDVALVTNCDVPDPYLTLLTQSGVKIIKVEFDEFLFPEGYVWGLAFYKLCALKHIVNETDYDYVAFIDSDVYIQHNFKLIWEECRNAIMLLDINTQKTAIPVQEIESYISLFEDDKNKIITRYGGEFFAANRQDAAAFISECNNVFATMISNGFVTNCGDEFITSIAAYRLHGRIKNAGAYVYRTFTRYVRTVDSKYQRYSVLHVPGEKEHGVIKLFDKYYAKGKTPSPQSVCKYLHLIYPTFTIGLLQRWRYYFPKIDLFESLLKLRKKI